MALFYDQYDINKKELFLASLFHDLGKTYDYTLAPSNGDEVVFGGDWVKTKHARRIHHVSRGALLFQQACDMYNDQFQEEWGNASKEVWDKAIENAEINEEIQENVTHAILSHHGRREWGSPVAPNTREAWILHLCDGMSARMYDCDTLDRLD
jgi:3'-5' exoribonuclease